MENAGGQRRARLAGGQGGVQMFGTAGAAAGDDGDIDGIGDGAGDLDVIAVLRAVRIHRRQHNFARTEALDLACPGDGLEPGGNAAAVDVDVPHLASVLLDRAWDRC